MAVAVAVAAIAGAVEAAMAAVAGAAAEATAAVGSMAAAAAMVEGAIGAEAAGEEATKTNPDWYSVRPTTVILRWSMAEATDGDTVIMVATKVRI